MTWLTLGALFSSAKPAEEGEAQTQEALAEYLVEFYIHGLHSGAFNHKDNTTRARVQAIADKFCTDQRMTDLDTLYWDEFDRIDGDESQWDHDEVQDYVNRLFNVFDAPWDQEHAQALATEIRVTFT